MQRPGRAEVPVELTWNLTDLFPSPAAWEAALVQVEAAIPTIACYQGRLGEGGVTLLACFEAMEALIARLDRVGTYASLQAAADGSDPASQAAAARVQSLGARVSEACSFIEPELLALPDGTVASYLAAEPGLAVFSRKLELMERRRPHMLSPETERVLAALEEVHDSPYTIYSRTKSSDMSFEAIKTESGESLPNSLALYEDQYEGSPDTAVRRQAYESFTRGLVQYQNTFAATLGTEVQRQVILARQRGYRSTEEMLLQPQEVSLALYNRVLDIIQTELAPIMQRYARLRRRVLKLERLLVCDLKSPLDPAYRPQIRYEQAGDLILSALAIMGSDYQEIMRKALTERWVDRAENVGKSTGAFCSSPYEVHPYILITWTDSMRGAFVLAHELGHAGHFALAQSRQRLVNTEPSLFCIEAPSTLNELLLGQYILAQSDEPRMRRWVIQQLLGTYFHNFVTHLLEGELQRRLYAQAEAGVPITAATLCETKGEILAGFWGDTVEIDEGARLTWMRQPHYYMGLYPYTYAAGLTAATAVAQAIATEGEPAVLRWRKVLEAGGTLRPLELLQLAGVDLSRPEPIRQAVGRVGELVSELERSY